MRGKIKLLVTWSIVSILLLISISVQFTGEASSVNGQPDARVYTYESKEGGEWSDDFDDETMVERTSGVSLGSEGYSIKDQNETIDFMEDYESYRNGLSLFGVNGWVADTTRALSSSSHQYTAATSGPTPMPSSVVSKVYNPSDTYSFILSKKLSVTSGTLSFWFSTDRLSSSSPSGMMSLMKSQSATPDNDDRVVGLMVKGSGVYYRTTPTATSQEIIGTGISENSWYRFEIRFDCGTDKASIYIFNGNGKFMGMAENINFISTAASIGRLELFTNRDMNGGYVTTYWDSIKLSPPVGQIFTYGARFSEDFQTYTNSQSLFGVNGWIEDTTRALSTGLHQFTASASSPPSAPSSMVGKVYNPDNQYSFILSQRMDITSGILTCWFATDTVSLSDASGMLSLMKSTSPTPSHDDRVLGLLIRDGGVNYRTTPTASSEVIVSSGINANTWYKFEIHFNCTTDKASIYLYERNGALLGAVIGIDLISDADSIGRIELFTNRDISSNYVTTYWDNIEIWGLTNERSVTTKVIEKPTGMSWTTLGFLKRETIDYGISLDILDEYEAPITGFIYDDTADEVDISPLNGLGVEKLKLRGRLSGGPDDSPLLEGWGVEWNGTQSWRDSYTTSLKTSTMTNTRVSGRSLVLASGQMSGTMITETIRLPAGYYWTEMKADLATGSGYTVLLDVLDASTNDVIAGMSEMTGNGQSVFDIEPIDPLAFKQIKIRVRLDTTGPGIPVLGSLSVSWKLNNDPFVGSLMMGSSIYRTEISSVSFAVGDPDQDLDSLDVYLDYRLEPEGAWETQFLTPPIFNETSGEWESIFAPTVSAGVGIFSFRVTVLDRLDYTASMIFMNTTEVLNNLPTTPMIELRPLDPDTGKDIEAVLVDNGTDVETNPLLYDYFWYVNDVWIEEETEYNLTADEISVLPSTFTHKHDTIRCAVRSYDLLDHSSFYSEFVAVLNTEPTISPDFPETIIIPEDTVYSDLNLTHYFLDMDQDTITYDHLGWEQVEFYILENGSVLIIPPENWTGSENITITVSDGEETVEYNITLIVEPVNDMPELISFTSNKNSGITGDEFVFTVDAFDIDNEMLDYIWSINGVATAHNTSSVSLVWDFDYWTNDEWMEKMNTKNATVSVVVSDGEFEIGPYQKVVSISLKEEEVYNAPPVISAISASAQEIYENAFVILEVEVTDPDGDPLTIYWTHGSDPGFNMSGASINVSGLSPGTYQFNLTVLDGKHRVTDSITVKVLELPPEKKDESFSFGLILIIIIVIVVLVLIIIAALWFLVFSKKDRKAEPEAEPQDISEEIPEVPPAGSDEVTIGDLTAEGEAPPEGPDMEIPQLQEPPAAPSQPPSPPPPQAPPVPPQPAVPAVQSPPVAQPPPPPQASPVPPPQPQPPAPES